MPPSVVPPSVNEPNEPPSGNLPEPEQAPRENAQDSAPVVRGSRWIDYDTHELLNMISELEDERRWARLREGILWAILVHILLISVATWIPKYVFRVPPVIDPFEAIKQRKDLSYLDLPPDLIKKLQPKVEVKPVPQKRPQIDRKTMDEMKKAAPPQPKPAAPETKPEPVQPQQQAQLQAPPPTVQPNPQSQSPLESPQPKAVPARPNFSMGSQNPADQLRDAMKGASQSPGYNGGPAPEGGLAMHPGAGAGGVQILSDTQGVDFSGWLRRWYFETEHTWDPLIPDEVNPPILKQGQVQIRFRVLPNGRLQEGSMVLEGRSGDVALDRAAWGALTGSNYPPLPHDFHGPYLELRAIFMYNMRLR